MNDLKKYNSVSELVRDMEDKEFADELDKRLSSRQFIKALMVLRARLGLSQQELSGRLNCTQSKVSKLEGNVDADISFGDLVAYTGAVGHDMRIFLVPKGLKVVDEVKMYAFAIKRLLHRLVKLAGNDKEMAKAVEGFLVEASFNLGCFVQNAAAALPHLAEDARVPVRIESPEVDDDPPCRDREERRSKRAEQVAL